MPGAADQFEKSVNPVHDAIARLGCGLIVGAIIAFAVATWFHPVPTWVPLSAGGAIVIASFLARKSWWGVWPYIFKLFQ